MNAFNAAPFLPQVQAELASLIEMGGFSTRDETPKTTANDGAVVVLVNDVLVLRIVRDRGRVDLDVASASDPDSSYQFATVCGALGLGETEVGSAGLDSVAREVALHFDRLTEAFAAEAWPKTRAACEEHKASFQAHFAEYAKWLETSGYTEQAAKATRNWQRRWLLKAALFVAGLWILLYGYFNSVSELLWWGGATIAVSFLVSGKHRGDPLPPMPRQELITGHSGDPGDGHHDS